jgi:transcriptional regulator with XRE-family HTH domain
MIPVQVISRHGSQKVMAVNLRRARHDRKITQEELAARSGLSPRYVGAIERADVSPSVTVLGRIADALAIEPGELLKRSRRTEQPNR